MTLIGDFVLTSLGRLTPHSQRENQYTFFTGETGDMCSSRVIIVPTSLGRKNFYQTSETFIGEILDWVFISCKLRKEEKWTKTWLGTLESQTQYSENILSKPSPGKQKLLKTTGVRPFLGSPLLFFSCIIKSKVKANCKLFLKINFFIYSFRFENYYQ